MLDEAKFLVKNGYAQIIYGAQDMNNFLSSKDYINSNNLFLHSSANKMLNYILA